MLQHFHETQRLHPAPIILIVVCAGFEAALALTLHANIGTHITQWAIVTLLLVTAIIFRELAIEVDSHELKFGFGPATRKVYLRDIRSVRLVEASLINAGIGIHYLSDGTWAWIARSGPAVHVGVHDSRNPRVRGYVISTSHPHDLISALEAGMPNRAVDEP